MAWLLKFKIMNTILFSGCTSTPLANYLKSNGLLRVMTQQFSGQIKGRWSSECFIIEGDLTKDSIIDFFLKSYSPSPIVAPWNGGSGFHPKDNQSALKAIQESTHTRFAPLREIIQAASSSLQEFGLTEKPDSSEVKEALLAHCRNTFPDHCLEWLDAAYVLTDDGAKFPPLLGTGGNDGRLEFTNNYLQRITELFDTATGMPSESSEKWLRHSLFADTIAGLSDVPVGQFSPAAGGGANATSGFSAKGQVNPWDYVLMLEGALIFASAAVKKLGGAQVGQLAYPFCVRPTAVGYGSAAKAEEESARCEIWAPLWKRSVSYPEIHKVFSEGRVEINGKPAKDGFEFTRAIVSLGVDRGIEAFERYAFHVRNGLAYYAVPLGKVAVEDNRNASDLLRDIDKGDWLDTFRGRAASKNVPSSIRSAASNLEQAIISLAQSSQIGADSKERVQEVLIALGYCEQAMANSKKWTEEAFLRPPPLLSAKWLSSADDGSTEYRIAAALASLSAPYGEQWVALRDHLSPVKIFYREDDPFVIWEKNESNDVVGLSGNLIDRMNDIMARRIFLSAKSNQTEWKEVSQYGASLEDVSAFINGECDDALIAKLLAGLCLLNWRDKQIEKSRPKTAHHETAEIPRLYAMLKLCFAQPDNAHPRIPITPAIHRHASGGNGLEASRIAARRLRASGYTLAIDKIALYGTQVRRIAAALLIPLWSNQIAQLRTIVHAKAEQELSPEISN